MRNLQEQVKKAFCHQKLFWPFTVCINCSSDLKFFANSQPQFSWSLEHFFLTVGQNNFGNKIPCHYACSFRNNFKLMCKTFHIDVESAQCPLETSRVRAPAIRWNSTACICLDFLPLKNEKSWGKPQCKRIFQINKIVWIKLNVASTSCL